MRRRVGEEFTVCAAPDGGDRFNIKKLGSPEPDAWMCLYRLES